MRLVASLIVHSEKDRYLEACIDSLLEHVDGIAIVDDGSDEETADYLESINDAETVWVKRNPRSTFFHHEGAARQELLEFTTEMASPTHILAIDADEFVGDLDVVRLAVEESPMQEVWTLEMEEVWEARSGGYSIRQDGGWKAHPVGVLWKLPPTRRSGGRGWQIPQRALACGRVPEYVRRNRRQRPAGSALLHVGWACLADRVARHERYAIADGGKFHAGSHLDSILWIDHRVRLEDMPWPIGLSDLVVEAIVARSARASAPVEEVVTEPTPDDRALEVYEAGLRKIVKGCGSSKWSIAKIKAHAEETLLEAEKILTDDGAITNPVFGI